MFPDCVLLAQPFFMGTGLITMMQSERCNQHWKKENMRYDKEKVAA